VGFFEDAEIAFEEAFFCEHQAAQLVFAEGIGAAYIEEQVWLEILQGFSYGGD